MSASGADGAPNNQPIEPHLAVWKVCSHKLTYPHSCGLVFGGPAALFLGLMHEKLLFNKGHVSPSHVLDPFSPRSHSLNVLITLSKSVFAISVAYGQPRPLMLFSVVSSLAYLRRVQVQSCWSIRSWRSAVVLVWQSVRLLLHCHLFYIFGAAWRFRLLCTDALVYHTGRDFKEM